MDENYSESKLIKQSFYESLAMTLLAIGLIVLRLIQLELSGISLMSASSDVFAISLNAVFMLGCLKEPGSNTRSNTIFVQLLLAENMAWFSECVIRTLDGSSLGWAIFLNYFFNLVRCVCNFWVIHMYYMYLSEMFSVPKKKSAIGIQLSGWIIVIIGILLLVNVKRGFLFTISEGFYVRGPLSIGLFGLAEMVLALALFFIYDKQIDPIEERAIVSFILLPFTGIILQAAFQDCSFIALTAEISTCIMYVHAQNRQVHIYQKKQAEEKALEAAIMVSQIRPHFLYNVLTSIACLCRMDPEKAESVTLAFANYLRTNIDVLNNDKPIPFSRELEHIKNYLNIELVRFADSLSVEYEIGPSDFEVPALSVQPLVENAVKYGIGNNEDGGCVKIISRELETSFEIEILDNGTGFDISDEENFTQRHVGIRNVRRRVELLCGGTLHIESRRGEGTRAVVSIPKEAKERK